MFSLDQVVPWGRSFQEYVRMFALTEADGQGSILGCGDGPAAFNAEATNHGFQVVSCDPIYAFSRDDIEMRIRATYDQVINQTRQNLENFRWDTIPSVENLGKVRMAAMRAFLDDYPEGSRQGRYIQAELPSLPFSDGQFDLALCSHLLFLYSRQLDQTFHHTSLLELCRVAREVRIFPLLDLGGTPSPHLADSEEILRAAGHHVARERVTYEFQRGANEMLRILPGERPPAQSQPSTETR